MRGGFERHPDVLDQASNLTNTLNEAYVERVRNLAKPEQVQNPDGSWPTTECEDCGDQIPEGRLKLGKVRCVSCQTDLEKSGGRR